MGSIVAVFSEPMGCNWEFWIGREDRIRWLGARSGG